MERPTEIEPYPKLGKLRINFKNAGFGGIFALSGVAQLENEWKTRGQMRNDLKAEIPRKIAESLGSPSSS
jgi:hypothetical protein